MAIGYDVVGIPLMIRGAGLLVYCRISWFYKFQNKSTFKILREPQYIMTFHVVYYYDSNTYIRNTSRCTCPTDFSVTCLLKVYLIPK